MTTSRYYAPLQGRGLVALSGPDSHALLQGVISQDMAKVSATEAAYGALLTPQGKYLHDFIIVEADDTVLLDCERERADDLLTRLSRYRLRSKVALAIATDRFAVFALWGENVAMALDLPNRAGACRPLDGGCVLIDPRHAGLGARAVLPHDTVADTLASSDFGAASFADYDAHRLALGVPDGSRDLEVERSTLLEGGIDALDGIAWDKGCYVGQELTARLRYRGLLKRRLVPVSIDGPAPPPGTPVLADDKEIGTMRTAAGGHGLALLRLDALDGAARFTAGGATIIPLPVEVPASA